MIGRALLPITAPMDFLTSCEFLGVLGSVCLIAVVWIAFIWTIGQFGWAAFAARYPAPAKPAARGFLASQANVGGGLGGYRNVLMARFLSEGVHVQATFPFNFGHRPFLLPWRCLQKAEVERTLFGRRFRVSLRCEIGEMRMTLPEKAQAAFDVARAA